MIGRERECDLLRGAVARVVRGGCSFVLVVGEPGIGKTALLRVLSGLAEDAGLAVGHGRGEREGAAPLWPWVSAFEAVDAQRGPASPRSTSAMSGQSSETTLAMEGGAERFAVFERFAADLSVRAADGPVTLVVDDLHWADLSALRLFLHLIDQPSLAGVLLAAGLRTTDPLAADAADVVSELLAHPSVEVIEVLAFSDWEVAAFVGERLARQGSDSEIALLAERSGGNPFFLGELLRWVPVGGSGENLDACLPLAVRESVRRRLVVEEPLTQQVVRTAAVAGSAASLQVLARVTGLGEVDVGRVLDCADRAGLVVVEPDRSGSVSFVHDLVRQAVLSLLPTWGRIQLHRAVATALLDRVGSSSWAAVVTHLSAARPLVDDAMLAEVAIRAAGEATRAGAFDEAADHLALALEVTEAAGDTVDRGRWLLQRGVVLWAAERAEESKAVFREAAALARRTADGELLAQVALSWRGGEFRPIFRRTDPEFLGLLREALTTSPSGDGRLRCLLLSRLARCAHWQLDDRDGITACDEAVAMARRLGDPEALINALGTRFYYRWRPELVRERLTVADEVLAIAQATGDGALLAQASYLRLVVLLELGWLHDAWRELDRFEDAVMDSGQPILKLRVLWFRATQLLALGDRSQADAVAQQASELASRMGRTDAAVEGLGQSVLLWAAEDRMDDVHRVVSPGLLGPVAYNAAVALTSALAGRRVEAAAALGAVVAEGLERFPREMSWVQVHCGLLAAAVVAGDRDTGQRLYDSLEPFAGQWAVLNPGIMVVGAVDHYLGLGAALLDRTGDAVDHLRRAAAAHDDQEAIALALLSLHELTTVLERRRQPGDDAEIARLDHRIAQLTARNTVPFNPLLRVLWSAPEPTQVSQQRQRLVLEGDTWLVEFGGARARLRDQRGLHHLRSLLERPDMEIPAITLAGADHHLTGSTDGTILDQRAMREYRERVIDLQNDVEEATANNDIERAARAEAELDALVEHLAAATGIHGRSRTFNGADERARVSVTKAIRSTISHLGEQVPELGRHLTATVHTGTRCVYRPDPRAPHRWQTERL